MSYNPISPARSGIRRILPRSLFGRALLIIVSPLILLQIVSIFVFYDQPWETLSWRLALSVAGDLSFVIDDLERFPDASDRARTLAVALRSTGLTVVYQPGEIMPNRPPDESAADPASDSVVGLLSRAIQQRVSRPFRLDDQPDGDLVVKIQLADGVLHAAMSRKRLSSSTTYVFLLWMIGSSLILFAIAGAFMRNQVRPIRRLAAAAERFGRGQDIGDFKPEGAIEVRRAAIEFNHMRDRITRQLAQRMEMLAGVSHDLRTPLTRLKLQLAMMADAPDVADLAADVAEMETLVDAYLAFVRGEGGEDAVDADVAALLEDVVAGARRQGASIDFAVDGDLIARARPNALRRAITNLVANACKYGKTVRISGRRVGGMIEIDVEDDGPGIPADQRDAAFRPFYRLEGSRNAATGGVGLGLAIARDLVRAHGGDIRLQDSEMGGLKATVRLPD